MELVVNRIAILKAVAVLKAIHTLSIKASASIEAVLGSGQKISKPFLVGDAENIKNPHRVQGEG